MVKVKIFINIISHSWYLVVKLCSMEKHNKVTFSMPESIEAALRKIAEETGLKLSTIVTQAIKLYVEARKAGR